MTPRRVIEKVQRWSIICLLFVLRLVIHRLISALCNLQLLTHFIKHYIPTNKVDFTNCSSCFEEMLLTEDLLIYAGSAHTSSHLIMWTMAKQEVTFIETNVTETMFFLLSQLFCTFNTPPPLGTLLLNLFSQQQSEVKEKAAAAALR